MRVSATHRRVVQPPVCAGERVSAAATEQYELAQQSIRQEASLLSGTFALTHSTAAIHSLRPSGLLERGRNGAA